MVQQIKKTFSCGLYRLLFKTCKVLELISLFQANFLHKDPGLLIVFYTESKNDSIMLLLCIIAHNMLDPESKIVVMFNL